MITISIDDKSFDVREIKDVAVYMLRFLMKHAPYSPLNVLKDNVVSMCEMVIELCDLHRSNSEKKNACTQIKRKMSALIRYIEFKKTNDEVHRSLYDSLLAMEGMGLLPGFQIKSKIHKGDKPHSNAERTSILS